MWLAIECGVICYRVAAAWFGALRTGMAIILGTAVLFGLSGCGTDSYMRAAEGAPAGPEQFPKIKVAPGDKLRITVFGEDKLSGDFDVDLNGSVSIPLAGTIDITGRTKAEAEQLLRNKLRSEYLKDPKVTVEIINFRPFYLIGQIEKPGEYPYKNSLNLISALAIGGGPTYRASKSKAYIQHGGAGPFEEVPLSPSVPVYPGDVIRVPERYF
jgi:protein involved in polysaccharide export with SLBB domain